MQPFCPSSALLLFFLEESWLGLLHHVCGEHTWAESSCSHEPETESNTKYLRKSSKAMEALRKIVLDAKWLKTLHFYVKFRHTGDLESFNSMMTKYLPKRMAFEYQYFIMRTLLAAIDHNMHLFRKPKESKQGQILGHRKFSKRTQRFHAEVVKEEKQYKYFPCLAAKMLHVRAKFKGSFSAKADTDEFNPKHIFPTIGMVPAPSTQELLKAPSRFKANVQGPDSENQIEGEKITTEEDAPISL
ncbi:uncharacterized protein LOC110250696 [Exaiptasia diaphana]|uniref:Uncharacterized protein n=1 Tax=Exaiptasia diaphana TaxID=2652724 RepID=A0A913Y0U5_EXADI|nr:uncharacterized protein LOC110250696 [Exaiptasia diaphana]